MKRFKMMLVAAVAILAFSLGAGSASAQTGLSDNVFSPPTGNFVSQAEADQLLTEQIITLKDLLATLTPGTQAYKTTETSVIYYSLIQGEIFGGKDIPSSIVTGLEHVGQDANGSAPKTQLWNLRTESIGLLGQ